MKKKYYFIFSSFIGIISLIYTNIINVSHLINLEVENVKNFLNEDLLNKISNPMYYYFLACIGILIFLAIIIIFISKKEEKYRTFLIVVSIILFFISSNNILLLIPLINLYFISAIPKISKAKKEIPIIENNLITKKDILKCLLLIIIYIGINFFLGKIILKIININSTNFRIIFNISVDIFLFIFTIILFYKELINDFKIFFKNFSSYINFILKNYGLLLLANIGVSLLITLFTKEFGTSQNQISLNQLPFWYLFPAASIYAPIVEEVVFRGCFRKLIKNDYLFLLLSAVSFGLLHTVGQEANLLNTILYSLKFSLIISK